MKGRVAVIGSGMAGLAAAWLCRQRGYAVTLFEAHQGWGMDAHRLQVDGGVIDVPLRVMSPQAWPSVLALAHEVGVGTFPVSTPLSCSWTDRQTWFRTGRLPILGWPWVGEWRYLDRRALGMARGLWQLRRLTRQLQEQPELTLAQALQIQPFDPLFWRGLVLPVLTTICTCSEEHLLAWPAAGLLQLLEGILHGGGLCRLNGGTSALVQALAKDLPIHAGSPVEQLCLQGDSVLVRNARGEGGCFERAVVATQSNQLGFLDPAQFAEERRVLADIRFDRGELWVHRDLRFMPQRQQDWTALNFQTDRQLSQPMFSVWVNAVEPTLMGCAPVLQTWNPLCEPAPELVLARIPLQRAVVHGGTARVHQQLREWHARPGRRVFFCGSWAHAGVPLLESAVRSAQAVVETID
ncbi:FAD-dependent oxidoreductase [Halopseudomonas yangmingensis]|uniref:Predicted NAD/FAD-binding protein n=1 Tax=Halopseudomonas yangmingensis TaxID=1720063 RepID=A0A1I4U1N6_9GAMM|nr:FAD-dependent oxidoreductase [Halopseudomonas yangmingensis]SFM82904.1 Predicted NAD/FAD-binding protein [Halopseudomonas yangmingensis]